MANVDSSAAVAAPGRVAYFADEEQTVIISVYEEASRFQTQEGLLANTTQLCKVIKCIIYQRSL